MLDGDHYVLNGQKIWTSYADLADWQFCLVRTDPNAKKQEGISFILFDMETPGVSVKPIKLISGSSPFCETFLTDVRVPVKNVVSKVNNGWTVAKALLAHERTMIADAFGSAAGGGKSKGLAATGARLPRLRERRARRRVAAPPHRAGRDGLARLPAHHAARARRRQGRSRAGLRVVDVQGLRDRAEPAPPRADALDRRTRRRSAGKGAGFDERELGLTRDWLRSRANTIEGGTSEVQLNIIAKRVLGLPD